MATESVTLNDDEFVQITDGTQGVYIQVKTLGAGMLWADSPTKPVRGAPCNEQDKELVAGSGLTIWARSRSDEMKISVTRFTE